MTDREKLKSLVIEHPEICEALLKKAMQLQEERQEKTQEN